MPNINYVIKNDLCVGCGICEGVCPLKAITIKPGKGRFLPDIENSLCRNDKGCHRCLDVCPGIGCNLLEIAREVQIGASNEDVLVGRCEKCFTGYSTDRELRYHAASGGMVTQMLIWLLETKRIDGAVVTSFDNSEPLMVRTFIATTREELFNAKGAKYAPVSLHHVSRLIKEADGNMFVIVGLPCHIQGLRKQEQKYRMLRNKIVAYFGLYCSCGRTFYLTEYVLKERGIQREELTYFAYRDEGCLGSMVAKRRKRSQDNHSHSEIPSYGKDEVYKERFQNYYHPLRSFFIPKRCLFCVDHYARLSDMSFGDIHIKPYSDDKIGINSVVARTHEMWAWLVQAKADGAICIDELPVELLNQSQCMAWKKYIRVGTFMKIAGLFGNKVPKYDVPLPVIHVVRNSMDYVQTRIQQFIGSHKSLWPLIGVLKSKPPQE
ncbi:MAG: Coenzyme F420 hydrogenase/dehydrogenase, beta subunit C-terminal domain [Paraprevotella sp.]|nr:Coenzyme F420 hydrogenase/dehydrogenase, beta subunit C-terminal domain [Paraprevotella sp.]